MVDDKSTYLLLIATLAMLGLVTYLMTWSMKTTYICVTIAGIMVMPVLYFTEDEQLSKYSLLHWVIVTAWVAWFPHKEQRPSTVFGIIYFVMVMGWFFKFLSYIWPF